MAGRHETAVGIARLHYPVHALGPGQRIGIWFQGCSIRCPGCMSRDTWDVAPAAERLPLGRLTGWVDEVAAVADAAGEPVDGVTISGGEPFEQPGALTALVDFLRDRFAPRGVDDPVDILVYSGLRWEVVERDHADALTGIDVLITEPYRRGVGGRWRGSANQRMIPLTPLGHQRYAEHVDAPADTGVQVDVRSDGLHLIGVPTPGEISRLEQALADRGVALEDCSWTT